MAVIKLKCYALVFTIFSSLPLLAQNRFQDKYVCHWDENTVLNLDLKYKKGELKTMRMTTNRDFSIYIKFAVTNDTIVGAMTWVGSKRKEFIFKAVRLDSNFLFMDVIDKEKSTYFTNYPFFSGKNAENSTLSHRTFSQGSPIDPQKKVIGKWQAKQYMDITTKNILKLDTIIDIEFKPNGMLTGTNFWLTKGFVIPENKLEFRLANDEKLFYKLNTDANQVVLYNYLTYGFADKDLVIFFRNEAYIFDKIED